MSPPAFGFPFPAQGLRFLLGLGHDHRALTVGLALDAGFLLLATAAEVGGLGHTVGPHAVVGGLGGVGRKISASDANLEHFDPELGRTAAGRRGDLVHHFGTFGAQKIREIRTA